MPANLTLRRLLSGNADASIRFADMVELLEALGFSHRIRGGHHIFKMAGIPDIINLQPLRGRTKTYQARQVRRIIVKYGIKERGDA